MNFGRKLTNFPQILVWATIREGLSEQGAACSGRVNTSL